MVTSCKKSYNEPNITTISGLGPNRILVETTEGVTSLGPVSAEENVIPGRVLYITNLMTEEITITVNNKQITIPKKDGTNDHKNRIKFN